jgi:hypothetical protein
MYLKLACSVDLTDPTAHTAAQADLMRLQETQHQAGLTVHMERAEHVVHLHHTDQQAHCHLVDQQDHMNHQLQAVVHQADLLGVESVHLVLHEHTVAHMVQRVPTVQCRLAVLPHGSSLLLLPGQGGAMRLEFKKRQLVASNSGLPLAFLRFPLLQMCATDVVSLFRLPLATGLRKCGAIWFQVVKRADGQWSVKHISQDRLLAAQHVAYVSRLRSLHRTSSDATVFTIA